MLVNFKRRNNGNVAKTKIKVADEIVNIEIYNILKSYPDNDSIKTNVKNINDNYAEISIDLGKPEGNGKFLTVKNDV